MSKKKLLQTISFQDLQNWSVKYLLENKFLYNDSFDLVKIGSLLSLSRESILLDDDTEYKRVTIKLNNGGVFLRDKALGKNIGTKKQFIVKKGQFLLSKIDARNGAFGLATKEVDDAIVTNDFPIFNIKETVINARFLVLITTTKHFIKFMKSCSSGTTNRQRIDIKQFLEQKIPLPPIEVQKQIVQAYENKINLANQLEQRAEKLEAKIEKYLYAKLGIEQAQEQKQDKKGLLRFVRFGKVSQWDFSTIFNKNINCKKYSVFTTIQKADLFNEIFRGKSPKYSNNDKTIILN